ncbi:MAG: 30S ribosomal protein S15 [Alphaproteobacteria bacterium]|nr:MAG: 30S ribosomal protein S15 [Alphaproteobacteria bacterium]
MQNIINEINLDDFKIHEKDTGSTEYQIAGLTKKIFSMGRHLEFHKKDVPVKRRIKMLVEKRRKLQRYLLRTNPESLVSIKSRLGIRN